MTRLLEQAWNEDEGVLTFEWVLLITVLVIGIVGGVSAVRDALVTELGDVVEAMVSIDQSYTIIYPWDVQDPDCIVDGASDTSYKDSAGMDQGRLTLAINTKTQGAISDCDPTVEDPSR